LRAKKLSAHPVSEITFFNLSYQHRSISVVSHIQLNPLQDQNKRWKKKWIAKRNLN